jgi:hypothetical protein
MNKNTEAILYKKTGNIHYYKSLIITGIELKPAWIRIE